MIELRDDRINDFSFIYLSKKKKEKKKKKCVCHVTIKYDEMSVISNDKNYDDFVVDIHIIVVDFNNSRKK